MNVRRIENELQTKWIATPDLYAPLRLKDVTFEPRLQDQNSTPDVLFELGWQDKRVRFVGEVSINATPQSSRRSLDIAIEQAKSLGPDIMPALITAYLSPGIIQQLEASDVSGLDLNGNYYIYTPDFCAIRLDQRNQYPDSRDIKNVFSYNSSLIGRFLLRENKTFQRVNDIHEGITNLDGNISLSTVSKVLKVLEGELLIERSKKHIRVLQPARLLEELTSGYRPPRAQSWMNLQLPDDLQARIDILNTALGSTDWIWSGESSAQAYIATTPPTIATLYTRAKPAQINTLQQYENKRFYNCSIELTNEAVTYFDRNGAWASKLETYLALSQLDKREQELADDIKQQILAEFRPLSESLNII